MLTVTHIFLLWAKDLISLADLAAHGGRARDRTCSMKRVVGPRPSSGRLALGMQDGPTVSGAPWRGSPEPPTRACRDNWARSLTPKPDTGCSTVGWSPARP